MNIEDGRLEELVEAWHLSQIDEVTGDEVGFTILERRAGASPWGSFSSDTSIDSAESPIPTSPSTLCVPFGHWPIKTLTLGQSPPSLALTPPYFEFPQPALIDDVIPLILAYADAATLCACSASSRQLHTMSLRDDLWVNLCKVHFGVTPTQLDPEPDPAKSLYILTHKGLQEIKKGLNQLSGSLNSGSSRALVVRSNSF